MGLNKAQLIADLKATFEDLDPSNTAESKAIEIGTAIDDYVMSDPEGYCPIYHATALTGGGSDALDSYDGDLLLDLDAALVITSSNFYVYTLDVDSGLPESSPDVIAPDINPGLKRWILVGIYGSITDHGALTGLGDDDHTQYRLESEDHSHQSTGLQGGKLDHGLALDGLGDDDHAQYLNVTRHDADDHSGLLPVDHGTDVTGLGDDDHTQYFLANGSRTLSGTLSINDTNTQIWEDGSSNLTFKDAIAGTLTLSELSCPPYIYIKATGQAEDTDLHLSDGTNWNTSKALIKTIRIETSSTDWDLYLLQNDNGYAADDATIPMLQIMEAGNGNETIFLDLPYEDEDASGEIHLYFHDESGSNTFDIYIIGYKLR